MGNKKNAARFSIVFSQTDPLHLQVVELLNRQGYRGKAQYIVNAVLHYENCDISPDAKRTEPLDEKVIEEVVSRILRDRGENSFVKSGSSTPVSRIDESSHSSEKINFDETMGAFGKDGFNAVVGALDMFRKKR